MNESIPKYNLSKTTDLFFFLQIINQTIFNYMTVLNFILLFFISYRC